MVSQDDFPDSWSCDSQSKHVKVEVEVFDDLYEYYYNSDQSEDVEEITVDTTQSTYIEIPTLEVNTIISTTENGGRKRTGEVYFPTYWDDIDGESAPVRQLIVSYGGSLSGNSYGKIYLRNSADDEWTLQHHGYIDSIGGTSREGEQRMWIYDVSELLKAKRADKTFWNSVTADVYRYLVDEANDVLPITDTVGSIPYDTTRTLRDMIYESIEIVTSLGSTDEYFFKKSFSGNRHSVYDVFTWFADVSPYTWEFLPQEEGVKLVFMDENDIEYETLSQNDGDIHVIQNTALNSVNPYNAALVKGAKNVSSNAEGISATSTAESGSYTIERVENFLFDREGTITQEYPSAEAYIPALVESASGERLYATRETLSDVETREQAEQAAVQRLKAALSDTSEGELELDGNTAVSTFTTLVAEETCNGDAFRDTAPVAYNVEDVRHECSVRDGKPYRTRCQVSVSADLLDIEVESQMNTIE